MAAYKPKIKCFGGVLHGRVIDRPETKRFLASDDRFINRRASRWLRTDEHLDAMDYNVRKVSYTIETFEQTKRSPFNRKYYVYRTVELAVIDGPENLLDSERREAEWDCQSVEWKWNQVPSILDFEDWWAWQQWKRRGLRRNWFSQAMQTSPWWDAEMKL